MSALTRKSRHGARWVLYHGTSTVRLARISRMAACASRRGAIKSYL
jgi:hypothetical protein